jgi:hypothetical protein
MLSSAFAPWFVGFLVEERRFSAASSGVFSRASAPAGGEGEGGWPIQAAFLA